MAEHPYYKLGRLEPDPAHAARAIELARLLTTPQHPLGADHLSLVTRWMLGANDQFGTCGPTDCANDAVQVWKYLLGVDITVSDEAVLKLYRTQNPDFDPATGAGDNGVELQSLLEALLKVGIDITHADGTVETVKPVAFAKVDLSNFDEVRAATSIFGGVTFGVTLEVDQQGQTDRGGPWDYSPSGTWGGHAVYGGAFTSLGTPHQVDETVVTWAKVMGTTDQFMEHQLDEAWVIIWPAHFTHSDAFQAGVDQAALATDYKALTGRDLPVPAPQPPPPSPSPNPNPNPKPPGWEQELAGLLQRLQKALQDLEHFLAR